MNTINEKTHLASYVCFLKVNVKPCGRRLLRLPLYLIWCFLCFEQRLDNTFFCVHAVYDDVVIIVKDFFGEKKHNRFKFLRDWFHVCFCELVSSPANHMFREYCSCRHRELSTFMAFCVMDLEYEIVFCSILCEQFFFLEKTFFIVFACSRHGKKLFSLGIIAFAYHRVSEIIGLESQGKIRVKTLPWIATCHYHFVHRKMIFVSSSLWEHIFWSFDFWCAAF